MTFSWFRRRIRHPFFPNVAADAAAEARGPSKALAGTFGELSGAAARGAQARRAVYVVTSENAPLSEGERDELWQLFEVPVYALLKRGDRVTAWECEAQNGLHIADSGDGGQCSCGRPGAKLMPVRALANSAG